MSTITAKVKLDYSGFLGGIRRVDAGLIEMQRRAIGLSAAFKGFAMVGGAAIAGFAAAAMKLKGAFDLGGELSDLSAATGESAGQVLVLRQAFANAGIGGDQFASSIARMQKALGGVDEEGKSTEAALARLGITAGQLSRLGAGDQLQRLAAGFARISDPSTRARTAMELFGRSGEKMLALFSDSTALDTAAQQVGGLATLMDENAAKFDSISDSLGTLKLKSDQLWAGIAEQLAPAIGDTADQFSKMDLTGVGAGIAIATQKTIKWGNALKGIVDNLPSMAAMYSLLKKIGFVTWGDMFEESNIQGVRKTNSGIEAGITKSREGITSEMDRANLLEKINIEIAKTQETLDQVESGTHKVFSSYKPERVAAVTHELKTHLSILSAEYNLTQLVTSAQFAQATAAEQTAESIEKAAKAQEKLTNMRGKAVEDVAKYRADKELADAESPEAKRKILLERSGQKDLAALEAEIARLEGLQKLGNSSTTEAEIADLKKKIDLAKQIADIDRNTKAEERYKAQTDIDDMARRRADLMDASKLPQIQVWASGRSVVPFCEREMKQFSPG